MAAPASMPLQTLQPTVPVMNGTGQIAAPGTASTSSAVAGSANQQSVTAPQAHAPTSTPAAPAATQSQSTSPHTNGSKKREWCPSHNSVGLWIGVAFGFAMLVGFIYSVLIQKWTQEKDFREGCVTDRELGFWSAACNKTLAHPMTPPPFAKRAIVDTIRTVKQLDALSLATTLTIAVSTLVTGLVWMRPFWDHRPRPVVSVARSLPFWGTFHYGDVLRAQERNIKESEATCDQLPNIQQGTAESGILTGQSYQDTDVDSIADIDPAIEIEADDSESVYMVVRPMEDSRGRSSPESHSGILKELRRMPRSTSVTGVEELLEEYPSLNSDWKAYLADESPVEDALTMDIIDDLPRNTRSESLPVSQDNHLYTLRQESPRPGKYASSTPRRRLITAISSIPRRRLITAISPLQGYTAPVEAREAQEGTEALMRTGLVSPSRGPKPPSRWEKVENPGVTEPVRTTNKKQAPLVSRKTHIATRSWTRAKEIFTALRSRGVSPQPEESAQRGKGFTLR